MRVFVIGLGQQRSPHHFREQLESGPIFARDLGQAQSWLGSDAVGIVGLDGVFHHSPVSAVQNLFVETLRDAARRHDAACYLVPGPANVGDNSVQWLTREFDVVVHPGVLDIPFARGSCRIVDALSLALAEDAHPFDAGREALDPAMSTIVTNYRGAEIQRLASLRIQRELGRSGRELPGDLLFIEGMTEPGPTASFAGLQRILSTLRSPDGCPWDREQTVDTLLPLLDEELEEFRDAWASGEGPDQAEELGDVLLHIAMMAQIARERGAFDASDVIQSISAKMVRRHPHVFADVEIDSIEELYEMWTEIKRQEKTTTER